jgi:hypothetical protein
VVHISSICADELIPATCWKAVKELSHGPDIAVARMARSAIDKAKGVETTLGEVSNRTSKIGKEGRREPERGNS